MSHRSGEAGRGCDDVIEIYKIYVEGVYEVSRWRSAANGFLLTLNCALLAAMSTQLTGDRMWLVLCFGGAAGVIASSAWLGILESYRCLNHHKFEVIHELEKRLPAAPFTMEWDYVKLAKTTKFKGLGAA